MEMLLMLFTVLAGGGWLLAKGIVNALFPKEKDPMDYWKKCKEPPVVNSHTPHTYTTIRILLSFGDQTKKKILEINRKI